MNVNVEALMHSLGKSYSDLLDDGLIPYKTPPTGFSGDPDLRLDMAKEGVYLSFQRNGRILKGIILRIQNDKVKGWIFPNDLPLGLKKEMCREWVHSSYGKPLRTVEPKFIMRRAVGRADLYLIAHFSPDLYMQIRYDLNDKVQKVAFIPHSELRW